MVDPSAQNKETVPRVRDTLDLSCFCVLESYLVVLLRPLGLVGPVSFRKQTAKIK